MSKSREAVAWMLADPARTQVLAALQYGVSQGAVSAQKTREDIAVSWCSAHRTEVDKACAELTCNPVAGARTLASRCGISEAEARYILLGLDAMKARKAALDAVPVRPDPVAVMREQCAKIAEMLGGEGVGIAAAIRSLEV